MAEIKVEKTGNIVKIHIDKADATKDTLSVDSKSVALKATTAKGMEEP
jgi:hypothetical protein